MGLLTHLSASVQSPSSRSHDTTLWRSQRKFHANFNGTFTPSLQDHNSVAFVAADFDRTRLPSSPSSTPSDEQARAFVQERMAYFGKVYASIGLSFYVVGNLADASMRGYLSRRIDDPITWIVPAASVVYLIQWAICRGSAKPLFALRTIDSTTTVLVAFCHSLMVFSGVLPTSSQAFRMRVRSCSSLSACSFVRLCSPPVRSSISSMVVTMESRGRTKWAERGGGGTVPMFLHTCDTTARPHHKTSPPSGRRLNAAPLRWYEARGWCVPSPRRQR
jgi:hypothetical protein